MSPFTRFVSRKMLGAVAGFAVFAIVAASIAGYLVAHGGTSAGSGTADVTTTQAADAQALGAALTDASSAGGSAADSLTADPDPAGRAQLRADLQAAFALKGDARRSALAQVRAKAMAGGYGSAVERRAQRRDIRHDLLLSLLPDNLQHDLQALKDAPADQRKQMRADILDRAVAGDYGPDVQKAAEQLKSLRQG